MLRPILWFIAVAALTLAVCSELSPHEAEAGPPAADPRGERAYSVGGRRVTEFRDTHGRVCTFIARGLDCDFPPGALGVER